MTYLVTIGLEIHAQLSTDQKIFSTDENKFTHGDNETISSYTMGLPGVLPVINQEVVKLAIRSGLGLGCTINKYSEFARKNYFYPDMPKGYQITQYEYPICSDGAVEIEFEGVSKMIGVERAHLEEDAAKLSHFGHYSLVNFNRCGAPLLEIVSRPEMVSPAEAVAYAKEVRRILRSLKVCDGNLEEGSLRVDCNISLRKKESDPLGVKVELKNLNSFRFIEKALDYEIERQSFLLDSNTKILQETRLYDSTKNKTYSMRIKEDAADYRYFRDPDLPPLKVTDHWIEKERSSFSEIPMETQKRYQSQFSLNEEEAKLLTEELELSHFFEMVVKHGAHGRAACQWVRGEVLRWINERQEKIYLEKELSPQRAEGLSQLIQLVENKSISGSIGKNLFNDVWEKFEDPKRLIEERGLKVESDVSKLEKVVQNVLANNPSQVAQFKEGKQKVFSFFVGQVMKQTSGKADPEVVNKLLREKLS